MTVLAHSLLHQILSNAANLSTDEIILELDRKINQNLNQHGISLSPMEGMDIGLFKIDPKQKTVFFTGAKIPAYHYSKKEIKQVTPDRHSIGGIGTTEKKFSCKSLTYGPGDILYLATDGYQDQFGGQKGRKFMKLHFRNLLNEVACLPFDNQENKLFSIFNSWKGNHHQTDDILIMGIQL